MYIYNALLVHGYSAFTLTILEYLDITNLSKEEAPAERPGPGVFFKPRLFLKTPGCPAGGAARAPGRPGSPAKPGGPGFF